AMISADAAEHVSKASAVPVFGQYETYLGKEVVGGSMIAIAEYGKIGAQIVARLLAGETPAQVGIVTPPPPRFLFDARQVGRWKISRSTLPRGSEILFDQKPIWREH